MPLELVFKQTATQCRSCHIDVHHSDLGADCGHCHTQNTCRLAVNEKVIASIGNPSPDAATSIFSGSCQVSVYDSVRNPLPGHCVYIDMQLCIRWRSV